MLEQAGEFLATAQKIYLALAVVGSVFFLWSLVASLFGGDFSPDSDCDGAMDAGGHEADGLSGLKFLSVKGVVAFITFFGWAGYFWGHTGWSGFALAFGCGALMMGLTAFVLWGLLRLQQSGNIAAANFINAVGTVYLTVPGGRAAGGKVTVKLSGCTRNVAVVADSELKTGTPVVVVEALGADLFLVKSL